MGWNHPNPIYMYPKRKRREQCLTCKYCLGNRCHQRSYSDQSYAELEGTTDRKCGYFEEGTKEDKTALKKKIEERAKLNNSCCIILCVLGTAEIYKLNTIRGWRDDSLKNNQLGRGLIAFYYHRLSPFMIGLIKKGFPIKKPIRWGVSFFVNVF